ncbi:hypothetical protein Peur_070475 [Populus x canadensis]
MVSSTLFMSEENRFFDSPEVNHQNEGRRSWISCPRAVYLESDLNICQANSHGGTTYCHSDFFGLLHFPTLSVEITAASFMLLRCFTLILNSHSLLTSNFMLSISF